MMMGIVPMCHNTVECSVYQNLRPEVGEKLLEQGITSLDQLAGAADKVEEKARHVSDV